MCQLRLGATQSKEYLAIEARIIKKYPEMKKSVEKGLPCNLVDVFGLQPTLDPVGDLSLEKVLRIIDESKSKTEMLRKLREAMKDTEHNYINW